MFDLTILLASVVGNSYHQGSDESLTNQLACISRMLTLFLQNCTCSHVKFVKTKINWVFLCLAADVKCFSFVHSVEDCRCSWTAASFSTFGSIGCGQATLLYSFSVSEQIHHIVPETFYTCGEKTNINLCCCKRIALKSLLPIVRGQ